MNTLKQPYKMLWKLIFNFVIFNYLSCKYVNCMTNSSANSVNLHEILKINVTQQRECRSGVEFNCNVDNVCIPNHKVCDSHRDCPNGLDESDDMCQKLKCKDNQFKCLYTQECINSEYVCDGIKHCFDASDESRCIKNETLPLYLCEFECVDGKGCIDLFKRCDGFLDCSDGSDEVDCEVKCPLNTFHCLSENSCISFSFKCDGNDDCSDGSDEFDCESKCLPNQHYCSTDGSCISLDWVCDGEIDCLNGEDENLSLCSKIHNLTCDPLVSLACSNGRQCYDKQAKCDGKFDCFDRSDELDCEKKCLVNHFQCFNGKCISFELVCNNKIDCSNGEDEVNCGVMCGTRNMCSHGCINLPDNKIKCTCPFGMKLSDNGHNCVFDDPCDEWGICSQVCTYLNKTDYKCSCFDGHYLGPDNRTCYPNSQESPILLYSNRLEIRKYDLETNQSTTINKGLKNTIILDYLFSTSTLLWCDIYDDVIYKASFDGGSIRSQEIVIDSGISTVEGIAIDWLNYKLYFVESRVDHIEVCNLDGSMRTSIVYGNMTNPRAIAVDPLMGLLFWTDWDTMYPRIERATLSGSNRTVIFDVTNIGNGGWPNGLALDILLKKVYYLDAKSNSIHVLSYDGYFHRLIVQNSFHDSHGYALSLYGEFIYWSDWKSGSIFRANKWNGSDVQQILNSNIQPFGITIYHNSKQARPLNYTNPCDTAKCSHLCLLSENSSYECECPYFMKLKDDSKTCEEIKNILFVSSENHLILLDYDSAPCKVLPPLLRNENLILIGYDSIDKYLYFVDSSKDKIVKTFLNSNKYETIFSANDETVDPYSVVFDYKSKILYIETFKVDSKQLYIVKFDGSLLYQVGKFSEKNSVAVSPLDGYIFMFETNENKTFLFRTTIDGSNRTIVLSSVEYPNIIKPKQLKVSSDSKMIYWISNDTQIQSYSIYNSVLTSFQIPMKNNERIISAIQKNSRILVVTNKLIQSINLNIKESISSIYSASNITNAVININEDNKTYSYFCFNARCKHFCVPNQNKLKNYTCLCSIGYELDKDGFSCRSISSFLVYSTSHKILGIKINNSNQHELALSYNSYIDLNINSLAFEAEENRIYWSDSKSGQVVFIDRDNGSRQIVLNLGAGEVESMAIDWIAKNLYWTSKNRIEVSRINGSHPYVIFNEDLQNPTALRVDPRAGYLFWINYVQVSRVERSNLDGSDRRVLYQGKYSSVFSDLALNYEMNTVFISDQKNSHIIQIGYDGKIHNIFTGDSFKFENPVSIDIKLGTLYLIEKKLDDEKSTQYALIEMNLETNKTLLIRKEKVLQKIRIYDQNIQKGHNPCGIDNGGCSHLCLFNGTLPICKCSHSYLTSNGRCKAHDEFIFYSKISSIESFQGKKISLNNPTQSFKDSNNLKHVVALAIDYLNKRLFYSDIYYKSIKEATFDGKSVKTLIKDEPNVEGLSYDIMGKNLYWTSYSNSSIKRVNVNPQTVEYKNLYMGTVDSLRPQLLVQLSRDDHPRAIAVDSCNGLLYWTNWNEHQPSIQTSNLDGSNVVTLVTSNIKTPNGLVIDHKQSKFYYADAKLDQIYKCVLNTSNCQLLSNNSRFIKHPFSLAIQDDWLYFSDWALKSVIRLDKFNGMDTSIMINLENNNPMGIVAVSNDTENCLLNPCRSFSCNDSLQNPIVVNGQCTCDCIQGYSFHNIFDKCVPSIECDPKTQFKCRDELKCIEKSRLCDKIVDCNDMSDEFNCTVFLTCDQLAESRKKFFKCLASEECFSLEFRCDGNVDCADASDEKHCECNDDEFYCVSSRNCIKKSHLCDGISDCKLSEDEANCSVYNRECKKELEFKCEKINKCITLDYVCDGINDCLDNSDETLYDGKLCSHRECLSHEYTCSNGQCIDLDLKCDGYNDCHDGSDEVQCFIPDCSQGFRCKNYECINLNQTCNGISDCLDSSDELNSKCFPKNDYSDECLNFPCGQLCTQLNDTYICSCAFGYQLDYDRHSCVLRDTKVKPFLIYGDSTFIKRKELDGHESILSKDIRNVVALDFNWKEQKIYFSDISASNGAYIGRMNLDGSKKEILHTIYVLNPDGIAVDWVADNLYWCDKEKGSIEVSKLNGSFTKTIINQGLDDPRGIVVYPQKSLLFYSDWGETAHIGRSLMDGSEHKVIINSSSIHVGIKWPNGLAIDHITGRLYWADAKFDYIAHCNLHGLDIRILLTHGTHHIFALNIFEDFIYWSDWETNAITRTHKFRILNLKNVTEAQNRPSSLQIIHPIKQAYIENHPCTISNGNCSDLCLLTANKGQSHVCSCADGYEIEKDGQLCVPKCSESHYNCEKSRKCIPKWLRCNGFNDCDFGEDEDSCNLAFKCPKHGMFSCDSHSGICIDPKNICDGIPHCPYGTDEDDCEKHECFNNFFKCNSTSKCILKELLCDGKSDCQNGEDEVSCKTIRCKQNQYKCNSGKCINIYFRCDGHRDCSEGEDEIDCHLNTCSDGNFRCNSTGKCIPLLWVCDNELDCFNLDANNNLTGLSLKIDDEDPLMCSSQKCDSTYFKCQNNQCIPGRWRCDGHQDCRDGSDEHNCLARECNQVIEFACKSDSKCIHKSLKCNGEFNCADGSDELDCMSIMSHSCNSSGHFSCKSSGFCIPSSWVCDGNFDCEDESDEAHCDTVYRKCKTYEFRCLNSTDHCINEKFVCDGEKDCQDGSDEKECNAIRCLSNHFLCDKSVCITNSKICNGVVDCEDLTDELFCNCTNGFQCENEPKVCLSYNARCDGVNDCEDKSDELNCNQKFYPGNCSNSKCEHKCFNRGQGYYFCGCHSGYKLAPNGVNCQDIDECSENFGYCSQAPYCLNLNGSALCYCFNLAIISDPERSVCKQTFFDTFTLVYDNFGLRITQGTIDSSSELLSVYSHSELKVLKAENIISIDSYYENQIYSFFVLNSYYDENNHDYEAKIVKHDLITKVVKNLSSSDLVFRTELPLTSVNDPKDIAVEWISKRIYWTEYQLGYIMCAFFDGSNETIVIEEPFDSHPLSLAVDSLYGKIYWSSIGNIIKIKSAYLDGTNKIDLVESKLNFPINLKIDFFNFRLYWLDLKLKRIDSISLANKIYHSDLKNGDSDRSIVYRFDDSYHPKQFDLYDDFLYVTGSTSDQKRALILINKFNKTLRRDGQKIDYDEHKTLETIKFASKLEHVYILNPIKQPNDTYLYLRDSCKKTSCQTSDLCIIKDIDPSQKCHKINQTKTKNRHMVDICSPQCLDYDLKCCSNRGLCIFNDSQYEHECKCNNSYTGDKCQYEICNNYCLNNGTCSYDKKNQRICKCLNGFKGKQCEISRCKNYCLNATVCTIEQSSGRPVCLCKSGYTGKRCDLIVDESEVASQRDLANEVTIKENDSNLGNNFIIALIFAIIFALCLIIFVYRRYFAYKTQYHSMRFFNVDDELDISGLHTGNIEITNPLYTNINFENDEEEYATLNERSKIQVEADCLISDIEENAKNQIRDSTSRSIKPIYRVI